MSLKQFLNIFKNKETDRIALQLDPSQTDTLVNAIQKLVDMQEESRKETEHMCQYTSELVSQLGQAKYVASLEKQVRQSRYLLSKYHKLLKENELCMTDWEAKYKLMTRTKKVIENSKKVENAGNA